MPDSVKQIPGSRDTLVWGEFDPAYEDRKGMLAYYRRADRNLLILANLKSEPENIEIGCKYRILLDNMNSEDRQADAAHEHTRRHIQLQAWQGMVLELMPE